MIDKLQSPDRNEEVRNWDWFDLKSREAIKNYKRRRGIPVGVLVESIASKDVIRTHFTAREKYKHQFVETRTGFILRVTHGNDPEVDSSTGKKRLQIIDTEDLLGVSSDNVNEYILMFSRAYQDNEGMHAGLTIAANVTQNLIDENERIGVSLPPFSKIIEAAWEANGYRLPHWHPSRGVFYTERALDHLADTIN